MIRTKRAPSLLMTIALLLVGVVGVYVPATGDAQVRSDVMVTLMVPPASQLPRFPEQWQGRPDLVTVTVTSMTDQQLVSLALSFVVDEEERGRIAESIDGSPFQPQFNLRPRETQIFTFEQVIQRQATEINPEFERKVQRDGLPGGEYTICYQIIETDGTSVSGPPKCSFYRVLDPDPPTLLYPLDDTAVIPQALNFQWTALQITQPGVAYRLVIKPRFDGQNPVTAFESNQVLLDIEVPTTTYFYRPSDPPFDTFNDVVGFVWQVQTRLNGRPYGRDQGRSPAETFRIQRLRMGPVHFRYPVDRPIVEFRVQDSEPAVGGVVGGAIRVLVDDTPASVAGIPGNTARFVNPGGNVILDAARGEVIEGEVHIDGGVALTAVIDSSRVTTSWDWGGAPAGSPLRDGVTTQLVMDLGDDARLGRDGLITRSSDTRALLRYPGVPETELTVVFSPRFNLGGIPIGVRDGHARFLSGGTEVARLTPDGISVGQDQSATAPIQWRFPSADAPVLAFDLQSVDQDAATGLSLVHGTFTSGAPSPGVSATFENVWLGEEPAMVEQGAIVIDGVVAVQFPFEPAGDSQRSDRGGATTTGRRRFEAAAGAAPGASIAQGEGLVLEIQGARISRDGLRPTSGGSARLTTAGTSTPSADLAVTFSEDFLLSIDSLEIVTGTATVRSEDGTELGTIGPFGYQPR